jgi:N-acetylmuramic acid 6-phosphate etherase
VDAFTALLERLGNPGCIASMADWTEREAEAYRAGGLVTYFADHGLVDVLCDTTEPSPTFKLPPFHPTEAVDAPEPWALVKNPIRETPATWERALCRPPRGLDWPPDLYRRLGAAPEIAAHPPELGHEVLHHYRIGREPEPRRWESGASLAILLRSTPGDTTTLATAFRDAAAPFTHRAELAIGPHIDGSPDWGLVLPIPDTPLRLYHHLALKLVLNTVSTATMARTGRILGNWMICVETTNKKLVDRGTRLVADLTGRAYADACRELFRTRAWLSAAHTPETASVPSAVALTVYRLRTGRHADLQGPPPSAETVLTALCSLPPLPSPESRPADP